MRILSVVALLLSCLTWACDSADGGSRPDGTGTDVGAADVGAGDAGAADVGASDVGASDAIGDAGTPPPQDVPGGAADGDGADVVPGADGSAPADVPGDGADARADTEDLPPFEAVDFPPRKLAFAFERPPVGEPVSAAEVTAFTRRIAATLHAVGYFRWLLRTSTGVDASTGREAYLAWYNDVEAVKSGDTVTFRQVGHEHNMWINSAKILSAVMGAYLHTGDWEAAKLTEQYCEGLTAVVKGFVWGEDDPAPWLMARAIFPQDQDFTLDEETWRDDGRRKRVEYSAAYTEAQHWNAETFAWPENPTWGSIWVTNMRSKDDVRAISRMVPFLHYVVEDAPDEWVRTACAETLETMIGFHKDIADEDYFIRTKDRDGVAHRLPCVVPGREQNKDLGSYSCYTAIDPRNECCARLSADMIAYGERRTNDCGTCTGSFYDRVAPIGNIYNVNIIWDYHMAGLVSSLVQRQHRDAWYAMVGLAERIDSYMDPGATEPGSDDPLWPSRMAFLLVEAAAVGLPLTADEVRHIHRHWTQAAVELEAWTNWDLWDESVPDGTYSGWTNWDWWEHPSLGPTFRPVTGRDAIPVQYFATLFEYCMSPFQNPAGAAFVDCDVLRDPATWGAD